MPGTNGQLVLRWFEDVWNARRAEVIDELLTPGCVLHAETGTIHGPVVFRTALHTPTLAALPDMKITIEALIEHGDEVVVRWRTTGTHTGDGLGFPATNKQVEVRGITWTRVEHGRLAEGWQSSNSAEVIAQLRAAAGA